MATSYKENVAETPTSLAADSSAIAKEAVALEAGRSKSLKRSHATALGSPETPVDPCLPVGSPPKSTRLDVPRQDQPFAAADAVDAVVALLDSGRLKDGSIHPGLNDATGYRVLTELSADNMSPGHHVGRPGDGSAHLPHEAHEAYEGHDVHGHQQHNEDHENHAHHEHHENRGHHGDHGHGEHDGSHAPQESHDAHAYHEPPSPRSGGDSMGMGGVQVTESPTPMEVDSRIDPAISQAESFRDDGKSGASGVSLSYSGAFQSVSGSLPPTPTRGMTYPEGPMSANKKYKCSDCNAEFTRHHNLKSHQLTHSQDKPFKCEDCPMSFRRLHDLKRHGKLHTGEKPHVCDKCHRRFARGDALVRHTKGVMGCSMARNSLGGNADGGDLDSPDPNMADGGDDGGISNIMFSHATGVDDDDQRRLSLPSLKTQPPPAAHGVHSRTYPQSIPHGSLAGTFGGTPPAAHAPSPSFAPTATMADSPGPLVGGQRPQILGVGSLFHTQLSSPYPVISNQPLQHDRRPSAALATAKPLPTVATFSTNDPHSQPPGHASSAEPSSLFGSTTFNPTLTTSINNQIQLMIASELKKMEDKMAAAQQAHDAELQALRQKIVSLESQGEAQRQKIASLESQGDTQRHEMAAKHDS